MKRSRFSEEQIIYALRQAESGTPLSDLCRQLGIAEQTFYIWKKKDAHLGVSELRRLRQLEEENNRLKRLVADLSLDKHMLSEALRKKSLRPARRRELAHWFRDTFSVSCARACRLAQFGRASWYRKSRAQDQSALRLRIRDLAHARPRFGYQRIWVLLRREGWRINRKRVRRLYRLDGLQLRMRVRRRKHIALHRGPAPIPAGPTERWSMDFVHDTLADGRPFRILTIVDNWSRSSPILEAGFRMSGRRSVTCSTASSGRARGLAPLRSIMEPNSNRARWKIGPTAEASSSTSFDRENQSKMPSLSPLTGDCVMSV